MKLGAFSVSLNVKDIKASKAFYENLGFQVLGCGLSQNWLILKNESCVIGLFQGMFDKNILTFNPGWNGNGENLVELLTTANFVLKVRKSILVIGFMMVLFVEIFG